ncbi:MAG: DUF2680 domain-containing protein [Desulfitobacterium sp.]|nr:DUF2680 domain-containing protein [Desulfitobacterium sp.]
MLKKFTISLLTIAFLTFGSGAAFGATTDVDPGKVAELKGLYQQMVELKMEMIDKQVEAGILEETKAEKIKEGIKERQKKIEDDLENGKLDFGKKRYKNSSHTPEEEPKDKDE